MMVFVWQLLLSGLAFDPVSRTDRFPSDPVLDSQGRLVVQVDKKHECFFKSMSEDDWKQVVLAFDDWRDRDEKRDFSSPIIKSHIERCRQ